MKKLPLLFASLALVSCSNLPFEVVENPAIGRFIAGTPIDDEKTMLEDSLHSCDKMKKRVQSMGERLFQAYLHGRVLLQDFDHSLAKIVKKKHKKDILSSNVYADLLATRNIVDDLEEKMLNYYLFYVKIVAHPKSSALEKSNADAVLKEIGFFLTGKLKESIPLPLKSLVLSNLIEKQSNLDQILDALSKDDSFTLGSNESKQALHDQRVLIRKTRMDFSSEVKSFVVDQKAFEQALKKERKKSSFKQLEREVESIGDDMQVMQEEARRLPSSDDGLVVYPSASAAGNISGNGYPENIWSITYDDGPLGSTSPTVLKNLVEREVKASIFELAEQVESFPKAAQAYKDAGMDMALHSYTHLDLSKADDPTLDKEITQAKKVIEGKLGVELKLFRLPYGAGVNKASLRQKIADNGMIHVFWNIDTLDWQDKNPDSIVERSVKQMEALKKNAGIVLFHDIHPQSVIASAKLIDVMKTKAIKFCTVQAVIDQLNKKIESCAQ